MINLLRRFCGILISRICRLVPKAKRPLQAVKPVGVISSKGLENPNNSEETVRALAGHVSRKMMEHYSHIRQKAKEAAIAGLETLDGSREISKGWAQNWAQSKSDGDGEVEKVLDFSGATRRSRTDDLLITNYPEDHTGQDQQDRQPRKTGGSKA